MRNLGTPVFSRRYFRLLAELFRDCMDVVTVRDGDRPIAAVMNFYFRDEVLPYYGGGTRSRSRLPANDFMYWEVMRRAAARGCRLFDFGRSKLGTGAFAFKKNWGFVPGAAALPLQPRSGRCHPRSQSAQPEIPAVHRGLETAAAAGRQRARAAYRAGARLVPVAGEKGPIFAWLTR